MWQRKFEELIRKFSKLIPEYQESLISKICVQYDDLKFLIAEKVKSGSVQTFNDVINYVLNDEEMKEFSTLLDISGTFQASSADCECGFSLMNSIKSKSRNRLQVDHLNNLMRIKFLTL